MARFFCYIIFLLPFGCFAQFTVTGRIVNEADKQPVGNATVFLSNASVGGKTSGNGVYKLTHINPGKYDLVVSVVGFETHHSSILINSDIVLPDIILSPAVIKLAEVKIKPQNAAFRERNLRWFKDYFLGTSALAKACTIKNPEILDIDYDDESGMLTASSDEFLIIENQELGYLISYLLKDFWFNTKTNEIHYEGNALFKELKGSVNQEKHWQKNRELAYENSSLHFFRAAVDNRLSAEGFQVQSVNVILNPKHATDTVYKITGIVLNTQDIIKATNQKGVYSLGEKNGALYISYDKNRQFKSKGRLDHLNKPYNNDATLVILNNLNVLFDNNGSVIDPNALSFTGAWANNRIAELLPSDYERNTIANTLPDSTVLKSLTNKFNNFSATHPVEKVHLHLDKPVYFAGDTIWYKTYTINGNTHRLSEISGVLYVELISAEDSVITHQILQQVNGTSWGDISLPSDIPSGTYRIRAYTNWMRNGGPSNFYEQQLPVYGLNPKITGQTTPTELNPDVQFFPEGGDLVNGLTGHIAVKAVNRFGKGQDINGTIQDDIGHTVAVFATQHLGMGLFALTPQKGKKYKAKINIPGKPAFTVSLPAALDEGLQLAVNRSNKDSIFFIVSANEQYFKTMKNSWFYLIAQQGGTVYDLEIIRLEKPVLYTAFAKNSFPQGVVQFTLFSASGQPLHERLAFIQNNDTLSFKTENFHRSYSANEKVNIGLLANSMNKKPASGSFSVSVINESLTGYDETAEGTILTDLLLTSDLKGYIEKPNYYFLNADEKTRRDLDLLMLTQGYRRFEWKKILAGADTMPNYKPEKFLEISGNVQTTSGKPVSGGKIIMTVSAENFIADTTTDSNGNFSFTGLSMQEETKVILNAKTRNNNKNVIISIKNRDYPPVFSATRTDTSSGIKGHIEFQDYRMYEQHRKNGQAKNVTNLKGVTINAKTKKKIADISYSANLNGPGKADQIVVGDNIQGCLTLSACLDGKLSGVKFDQDGTPLLVRTRYSLNRHPLKMVIIVNGNIMDGSLLNELDANNISSIEVLKSGSYLAIYGSAAPGGALVITTKRTAGNLFNYVKPAGLATYSFPGFYKARTFYIPKYSDPKANNSGLSGTVYWNPNLLTDKNGKTTIEYANGGAKGTYKITIEGIDVDGNLGRAVYKYEVK